jgi:uncharacterized protein YegL
VGALHESATRGGAPDAKPDEYAEGVVTLGHPLFLVFLAIPIAWVAVAWRSASRRSLVLLKAITISLIVLALAEPAYQYEDSRVAVAVLADTSSSLTQDDLTRASQAISAIQSARGSRQVVVLPFARSTRALRKQEYSNGWSLGYSGGEAGRATNIEAAIRDGIAALPSGASRRVVLISDGNENTGTVTRAAWQAQQLGVPIDAIALSGRSKPDLRVESVAAPGEVFSAERFPVELTIASPTETTADVELEAEGRALGSERISLHPGLNRVRIRAAINTTGAIELAGRVRAEGLGQAPFQYAMTVRRPRVLIFSDDPREATEHLIDLLAYNQFEVEQASRDLPADLSPYQLIVYNNRNIETIGDGEQARLEQFEQAGGGLLWIAGEKNVYVDHKEAPEKPLARSLPAKLAPPRSPESTCVILIIDKSSSMEGKKMDLARLASIGVIENLRPRDMVAVLIFDNSFQWAVPLRKAEDKGLIKRLISGITPDGGTQIAPALAEAYRRIENVRAVYKHIVLLTDGISEEGDSIGLAREASLNRVTISTVGLGQDVNRTYLEKIAATSKGKSYFLLEPSGLEQILLRDVKEHTGTTAVEKPLKAEVKKDADVLKGVDINSAPVLQGYVRFEARADADEILRIDEREPLLVRWQYGLGRSAVFTSDAKNRWASGWLKWKDFDRFWTNVVRDLLPHAPPSETTVEYDPGSGELVTTYRLGRHIEEPSKMPDIFVLGPGQYRKAAQVSRISPGIYRAKVEIGSRQGLFRIRPLADSRAFPEAGFYRNEAEFTDYGTNQALLKQLTSATGGRYNPSPGQVFDSTGKIVPATLRFWPGLLAAAVVINLIELISRKWKGLREWLAARPAPAS